MAVVAAFRARNRSFGYLLSAERDRPRSFMRLALDSGIRINDNRWRCERAGPVTLALHQTVCASLRCAKLSRKERSPGDMACPQADSRADSQCVGADGFGQDGATSPRKSGVGSSSGLHSAAQPAAVDPAGVGRFLFHARPAPFPSLDPTPCLPDPHRP
jgi:hypothetical protein